MIENGGKDVILLGREFGDAVFLTRLHEVVEVSIPSQVLLSSTTSMFGKGTTSAFWSISLA